MKCNQCKKIIPTGEGLILDKSKSKQYLHEECSKVLEQAKQQEQLVKKVKEYQQSIILLSSFTLLFGGVTSFFCFQKNKTGVKFFFCWSLGLLTTTIVYAVTNSLWSILFFTIFVMIGKVIAKSD